MAVITFIAFIPVAALIISISLTLFFKTGPFFSHSFLIKKQTNKQKEKNRTKTQQQQQQNRPMFRLLWSEVFRAYLTEHGTSYWVHSLCCSSSLKRSAIFLRVYIPHLSKPWLSNSLAVPHRALVEIGNNRGEGAGAQSPLGSFTMSVRGPSEHRAWLRQQTPFAFYNCYLQNHFLCEKPEKLPTKGELTVWQ